MIIYLLIQISTVKYILLYLLDVSSLSANFRSYRNLDIESTFRNNRSDTAERESVQGSSNTCAHNEIRRSFGKGIRLTVYNLVWKTSCSLRCYTRRFFREIIDFHSDFTDALCRELNERVSSVQYLSTWACAESFATLLTTTLGDSVVLRGQICHLKITAPLATCTNKRPLRTVIR